MRQRGKGQKTEISEKAAVEASTYSDYDTDNHLKEEEVQKIDDSQSKPKEPLTLKKVMVRSITASFLAALYLSIVSAGHFYCILAVILTQV
jgi:hypothetical protein